MNPFRSSHSLSPTLKRIVYVTAAVPTVVVGTALVQGVSVLIDYRSHHKDAPQPISPASGVVVIGSQDAPPPPSAEPSSSATCGSIGRLLRRTTQSALDALRSGEMPSRTTNTTNNRSSSQLSLQSMSGSTRQPLRLLVVGDSLAVGVGISASASPVLPESISRALSKALGGRAVRWTCIGTSGASAGRIVRDIEFFHTSNTNDKQGGIVDVDANDDASDDDDERRIVDVLPRTRKRIRSWLERNLDDADADDESTVGGRSSGHNVRKVKRWLHKRLDNNNWLGEDEERYEWKKWRARNKFREYDVAVVLTGLNDVKDAALPFLSTYSKEEKKARKEEQGSSGGYEGELTRILQVLKDKMNHTKSIDNSDTSSELSQGYNETIAPKVTSPQPLIVLPGLPANIVPVFQWVPLKWFLLPLIHSVDRQKRSISKLYRSVLFVNPPPVSSVESYEAGLGPIISKRRAEQVQIIIQDIGQKAKEKVEAAMDKYYEFKEKVTDREVKENETERYYEQSYHQHSSAARPIAHSPPPGSKLFSADGIHPNDDGVSIL